MNSLSYYASRFLLLSVMLYLSGCSSNYWNIIGNAGKLMNPEELAEDVVIGKFAQNFRKEKPINTSIEDAYKRADGIEDFSPQPVSKAMMDELRQDGKVMLKPGVYDFYLQSFCLHAGKYAPTKGSGYLIAPLKGSKAEVIQHLLENYGKHPDILQTLVQSLIWDIEVGTTYGELPIHLQIVAKKLLSNEDLEQLGKSFWDVLPSPVRRRLFTELRDNLPEDIRDTLKAYDSIKTKINSAGSSYEEIEAMAVNFSQPPIPKDMRNVPEGTWSNIDGGYYIRAFPNGFS